MTTLKEQQMLAAHQLGIRDYTDGRALLVPVFLTDNDVRVAYEAGWRGAAKRALEADALVRMPKNPRAPTFREAFGFVPYGEDRE